MYATYGGAFAGDFARNALYHNPGTTNGWVKMKLAGVKANRQAIGARVKINLETPNGLRALHRVVSSGGSFGGNPLRLEVGLGNATAIRSVEILWPGSGTRQTVTGLALRKSYEIREGGDATELKMTPVNIKHEPKPRMKFFEATNR